MTAREDDIRRVLAELDVHIAEVEASVTVLKALLADDETPQAKAPRVTQRRRRQAAYERVDARPFGSVKLGARPLRVPAGFGGADRMRRDPKGAP